MKKVVCRAPAKINLTFEILGKRSDGYHDISSVVQTIDIYDTLTLTKRDTGAQPPLVVTGAVVADVSDKSLIVRAVRALERATGLTLCCEIHLDKTIPIGAGLGGGSSDAAATLVGLTELFDLPIKHNFLMGLGATIGADVPLFIEGGLCRLGGTGNIIEPLKCDLEEFLFVEDDVTEPFFVVFRPHKRLSTTEAYAEWDRTGKPFADMAREKCPQLDEIFKRFHDAIVSGKGPSTFIMRDMERAYGHTMATIEGLIDPWNGDIFIARPCDGIQFLEGGD